MVVDAGSLPVLNMVAQTIRRPLWKRSLAQHDVIVIGKPTETRQLVIVPCNETRSKSGAWWALVGARGGARRGCRWEHGLSEKW